MREWRLGKCRAAQRVFVRSGCRVGGLSGDCRELASREKSTKLSVLKTAQTRYALCAQYTFACIHNAPSTPGVCFISFTCTRVHFVPTLRYTYTHIYILYVSISREIHNPTGKPTNTGGIGARCPPSPHKCASLIPCHCARNVFTAGFRLGDAWRAGKTRVF